MVADVIGQTAPVNLIQTGSTQGLTELPPHLDLVDPDPFAGPDHPMRVITREVAFDGVWNAERAARVAQVFDSMASDWSVKNIDETKAAPIADGLDRGEVPLDGRWLELGSGTGAGTIVASDRVSSLVAFDLAAEMLANAPAGLAPRVRGDASRLPFGDNVFDGVLMVNMLLFPHEVARVLTAAGAVLWVNTLGDQTPIHLPPADVSAALPGTWVGLASRAGSGFWTALRRSANT